MRPFPHSGHKLMDGRVRLNPALAVTTCSQQETGECSQIEQDAIQTPSWYRKEFALKSLAKKEVKHFILVGDSIAKPFIWSGRQKSLHFCKVLWRPAFGTSKLFVPGSIGMSSDWWATPPTCWIWSPRPILIRTCPTKPIEVPSSPLTYGKTLTWMTSKSFL